MSKKEEAEVLVNFKMPKTNYEKLFFLGRNLYGHGAIKKIYNDLSNEFINRFDGKSNIKLDSFLDPNFTPKPIAFDDLNKIVVPFIKQLSNQQLHEFRVWAYQISNLCAAYSKLSEQKRKVTNMTYEQCIELIGGPQ